jgi:hypothetical protein
MDERENTSTRADSTEADCSGYVGVDHSCTVTVTPYRPPVPRGPVDNGEAPPRS